MNKNVVVGQRVSINIASPDKWTDAAHDSLNGKTGVIAEISGPRILVTFDTPAKPFYTYGSEHKSFWFSEFDLEEM